jgi:hypothetical protein
VFLSALKRASVRARGENKFQMLSFWAPSAYADTESGRGAIREGGETTRPKCSSAEVESLSECRIERLYTNGFLLRAVSC